MNANDKAMAMEGIRRINSSWDQKSGATPAIKEFVLTEVSKKPRDKRNYEVR